MKVKVKKIDGTRTVNINGKDLTVTKFITEDDQIVETFSKISEGEEMEGEITEDKYGKKFKRARTGQGGFGRTSNPNTMLISYAKDVVCALIEAGKVKEKTDAADLVRSFSTLFFGIYEKKEAGQSVLPKEEEKEKTPVKTETKTKDDEKINLDDVPF